MNPMKLVRPTIKRSIVAVLAAALLLTPLAFVAGMMGGDRLDQQEVQATATSAQRMLEGRIATAQQAAFGAATIMTVQPDTTREEFAVLARIILGDSPHITRVAYARLEGDRAPVVYEGPVDAEGLSPRLGIDLLDTPLGALTESLTPAGRTTRLISAEHNGREVRCFVVLYPVLTHSGDIGGYVFTEVDVDALLAEAADDRYVVEFADPTTATAAVLPSTTHVSRAVDVVGTPWKLTVARAEGAGPVMAWLGHAAAGGTLFAIVGAGALLGLVSSHRTDLQRIRQEQVDDAMRLRVEEIERSHLASVVDGLADAIVTIDRRGVISSTNAATEALFAYPPGTLVGRSVSELMPPEYRAQHSSGMQRVAAGGESRLARRWLTLEGLTQDGERFPLELYIYPIERDGQPAFAGIMRRVGSTPSTPDRSEFGSDFVAHAAHEMRGSLIAVTLSLELLEMRAEADGCSAETRSVLTTASAGAGRLAELLQGLMDFRRVREGAAEIRRTEEDFAAILMDVLAEEQRAADQRRIAFAVQTQGDITVSVDRRWIRQVVANLVRNATKYGAPGTSVTIDITGAPDSVRLSVADCGPGIPEEFRPHVFEMFSRAPGQQVSGNGIGLALAREIVQMHGGEIGFDTLTRAEVESNSGTTFWIELPRQA